MSVFIKNGINTTNLYQSFTNTDLTENKSYISNAFKLSSFKINQARKLQKKKKNMRIINIIGASAFVASVLSISAAISLKDKDAAKKILHSGFSGKIKKATNAVVNASINFTNLKDDLWDRLSNFVSNKKLFKFIHTASNKANNAYKNVFSKVAAKKLDKAQKAILKASGGSGLASQLVQFDKEKITSIFDIYNKELTTGERISSVNNIFGKQGDRSLKKMFKNATSPLATIRLQEKMQECLNVITLPKDASEELKLAVDKYHKLQKDMIFPKMRDVSCGCGATDVITIGIPILAFAASMAIEDNRNERKSKLFNLGLPIAPALFLPVLGLFHPYLSGGRGMAVSLAVGQVVSRIAKFLDKKFNPKFEENEIKS